MSLRLYSTAVLWEGGKGVAKLYGVMLALADPPPIPGHAIVALRYIPEIALRSITRGTETRERTMTDDEARELDVWIRRTVI